MLKHCLTILLFSFSLLSFATDIPAGNVNGIWSAENSPYIIQGNIRIPEDESLTIEPGVEVLFEGAYNLRILGNFSAIGNATDSITFNSTSDTPLWKGINLDSLGVASDTARFSHCRITNLNQGRIYVNNTDKVLFEDSRMWGNEGHFAGCFFVIRSDMIARRSVFTDNHTTNQSDGGVFYIWDGSPLVEDNVFKNNSATYSGGAISIWRNDHPTLPVIRNNHFENNTAGSGGAIVIHSNCVPTIENNTFIGNHVGGDGGAIWQGYVLAGTVQYKDNYFEGNHSNQLGGAIRIIESLTSFDGDVFENNYTNSGCGGALQIEEDATVQINNCRFSNNQSTQGGAVHVEDNTVANFSDCFFNNNHASSAGGAFLLTYYVTSDFTNCVFVNNEAGNIGGVARLVQFSNPNFINCTFANNKSVSEGSAFSLYWDSDPKYYNCIFYGNTSVDDSQVIVQDYIWNYCDPSFSHCLVEGGESSIILGTSTMTLWENNIDTDPLFVFPTSGSGDQFDAQLASWEFVADLSPCIDNGTIEGINIPENDFLGNPRIQGEFIDLGAFEGGAVILAPTLNNNLVADTLCTYESLTLAIDAEGTEPLNYSWFFDGNVIDNENDSLLSYAPGEFSSGNYQCVVSNVGGEISSSQVWILAADSIFAEIEILEQPFCPEGEFGSGVITISGGIPPYDVSLDGMVIQAPYEVEITGGQHLISVTDNEECISDVFVEVEAISTLYMEIDEIIPTTCDECNDGALYLEWGGLNPVISLNGIVVQVPDLLELTMGEYVIEICDDSGCCITDVFTVEEDGFPQEIDFNGDGIITTEDFLEFVGNFGCIGEDCVGDLNGDGLVNVADLMIFLGLF